MKKALKKALNILRFLGFNPLTLFHVISAMPSFIREYVVFTKKNRTNIIPIKKIYPCLSDRFSESGSLPEHYFFQDLLVAQKIFSNNPIKHVDIGSRIDGFVAHVASFRTIEVFDIRPLKQEIPNLIFHQIDMTEFDQKYLNYADSISCLHALEHFGLGRYGDRIDPDGHLKGFDFIKKMIKPNGLLYLSVPIGKLRIEFNAHRVFSLEYIINWVTNDFIIERIDIIDDNERIFYNYKIEETPLAIEYGCGIFTLKKRTNT